jgi:hypothetical protein
LLLGFLELGEGAGGIDDRKRRQARLQLGGLASRLRSVPGGRQAIRRSGKGSVLLFEPGEALHVLSGRLDPIG